MPDLCGNIRAFEPTSQRVEDGISIETQALETATDDFRCKIFRKGFDHGKSSQSPGEVCA